MSFKFHHTHLVCSDLTQTIHFFETVLGAKFEAFNKFGTAEGAKLNLSGTRIFLRAKGEGEEVTNDSAFVRYGLDHLALETDDVDAVYKDLKSKGYHFSGPPQSAKKSRIAFLKGPDNITIELLSAIL